MDIVVEKIHEIIKQSDQNSKKNIYVKVDVDVDGYTSASILIQFLKFLNPTLEIIWETDYNKSHGLTYENLRKFQRTDLDLIIIPDASMTCYDAKLIKENFNADIIVMDHHIVEIEYLNKQTGNWISKEEAEEIKVTNPKIIEEDKYTNYCLNINCHDGNYPNENLSGAGIVQKFIEAYLVKYKEEDKLDDCLNEYFYDLVSLGLISDAMDARNLETRYYMIEGLKKYNYKNSFITELVKRNEDEFKFGRTIKNTGWVLGPRINAVIRYGKEKEQNNLFRAILDIKEDVDYQPRRKSKNDPKPPIEKHSLQWDMARVCDNVKQRQDTEVRNFMKEIDKEIIEKKLLNNSVLFVDGTKVLTKSTVTGLIANKLASKYYRPVVLMKEKDDLEYGGSVRGYDKGPIPDIKSFLEECGMTVKGHSNAGGIFLKKDKLNEVIKKCNQRIPLEKLCTIHTVDWEIPANQLKKSYVQEVAENYSVFGNGVQEPVFAITNLKINASKIAGYGENKGFIRFAYNGITFTKKYCPIGDFDKLTLKDRKVFGINKKPLILNLICQFVLNSWEDKINPEVKILYYESNLDESESAEQFDQGATENRKIGEKNNKKDLEIDDDFIF